MSKLSADATNRTLMFSRPGKGKDCVYVGYGAGEDVVKVADTLVYHSAHTKLTAGDHALGRYLVHRAYRQIRLLIQHFIPARDALVYLGSNHAGLIESLTRLRECRIIISTFDDDGAPCEISCNYLDFEFHEETGMLLFSFAILASISQGDFRFGSLASFSPAPKESGSSLIADMRPTVFARCRGACQPFVARLIAHPPTPQMLTSRGSWREVFGSGVIMADKSQFSIVTYQRSPGNWRAAITPFAHSGLFIRGRTTTSFVTPDDYASEPDATVAAEKMIRNL